VARRAGAKRFSEIWPLIEKYEPEVDFRREFTTALLELVLNCDVGPRDIRGRHSEVESQVPGDSPPSRAP
jgi:hypothetical protein